MDMDIFINKRSYESCQLLSAPVVSQVSENEKMDLLKGKNFETCRLCLMEIVDTNITLLDGIIKDMLEIILPELNLSICESPPICKSCLETLKQSYNFKSSCLEVEDKVQDFVDPKCSNTIDLKNVLKKENIMFHISENHVVCRTCLGLGEESTCSKISNIEGDPLKNMVEKCLPEMGIELTRDPVICPACLEQLEEQFHFIMKCLDSEEKINYYCERKHIYKQIDLHSVYVFSMMDDNEQDNEDMEKQCDVMDNENLEREITAVKIESLSESEINASQQRSPQNKHDETSQVSSSCVDLTFDFYGGAIKTDKIMKDLSANRQKPNVDNFKVELFKQVPLQRQSQPINEKVTFQVCKDDNGDDIITSETSLLNNEDSDNSDVSVSSKHPLLKTRYIEPVIGSPKRREKNSIKAKKITENMEKIVYKDDEGGDSDESVSRKKRLITRKCKLCDFKTKYTSRMKAHKTVNHSARSKLQDETDGSPKKTAKSKPAADLNSIIKCRACPFKTKDPEEYKKHKQKHKKEKEQKCDICGMCFVRGDFLKKHIENHKNKPTTIQKKPTKTISLPQTNIRASKKHTFNFNGQFLKMYKCKICPYQTRMKSNLAKHSMTHKKITEIITHKCKICNFETIQKENFLSHMQNHSTEAGNRMMRCFLCSFQPKTEEALKQHVNLVHKSGTG